MLVGRWRSLNMCAKKGQLFWVDYCLLNFRFGSQQTISKSYESCYHLLIMSVTTSHIHFCKTLSIVYTQWTLNNLALCRDQVVQDYWMAMSKMVGGGGRENWDHKSSTVYKLNSHHIFVIDNYLHQSNNGNGATNTLLGVYFHLTSSFCVNQLLA